MEAVIDEERKALLDLCKDVIDEVATQLPESVTGQEAVAAILARFEQGMPRLVAVELVTLHCADCMGQGYLPAPRGAANLCPACAGRGTI